MKRGLCVRLIGGETWYRRVEVLTVGCGWVRTDTAPPWYPLLPAAWLSFFASSAHSGISLLMIRIWVWLQSKLAHMTVRSWPVDSRLVPARPCRRAGDVVYVCSQHTAHLEPLNCQIFSPAASYHKKLCFFNIIRRFVSLNSKRVAKKKYVCSML